MYDMGLFGWYTFIRRRGGVFGQRVLNIYKMIYTPGDDLHFSSDSEPGWEDKGARQSEGQSNLCTLTNHLIQPCLYVNYTEGQIYSL